MKAIGCIASIFILCSCLNNPTKDLSHYSHSYRIIDQSLFDSIQKTVNDPQYYSINGLDSIILGSVITDDVLKKKFKDLNWNIKLYPNPYVKGKTDTLILIEDIGIKFSFYKADNLKILLTDFNLSSKKIRIYKDICIGQTKADIERILPNLKILKDILKIGESGPTECNLLFYHDTLVNINYTGYVD